MRHILLIIFLSLGTVHAGFGAELWKEFAAKVLHFTLSPTLSLDRYAIAFGANDCKEEDLPEALHEPYKPPEKELETTLDRYEKVFG